MFLGLIPTWRSNTSEMDVAPWWYKWIGYWMDWIGWYPGGVKYRGWFILSVAKLKFFTLQI